MKRRLIQFYNSFGDRGVMFILYALAVVANSLPAIFAELPAVFPDEINSAGTAALYSGRNWSGLLEGFGGGSGYVLAVFYAPLLWVIKNPYALYKAMLILNALIVGFIPLIAYHLAGKFGVVRVRRKLLIALCCGLYVAYITDSKFIWNETPACLMGWILALCLFSSWERKSRSSRAALSVLVGFLCAVAYAANTQLIGLVAALILTVVLARLFMRERILNLPVFGISLAASFTAEHFLRQTVSDALWGGSRSVDIASGTRAAEGFFGVFFTQLYAFMTSSVGIGALAAAIFVVMMFSCLAEGIKDRPKTLEDGTKVYEPIKHKYSMRLTVFALFQFLAVVCTAATAALFASGTGGSTAELAVFGRYTDNIAPLSIFLVLVYIFLYGIDLAKPLIGAGVYGYSCICFAVVGLPVAQMSEQFRYSALFGLFELFGGEDASKNAGMNCIIMSSLVFTLYALIIVLASCTRKHRTAAVTGTVFCVMMAATIYTAFVFLPGVFIRNSEDKEPVRELMSFVYNDSQSPPIVVYNAEPETAATLQFLAPETRVRLLKSGGSVTESCLLIAKSGVQPPFEGGSYDIVGRTSEFTVYAFGDNARDFIRYSSLKDSGASGASSTSGASNSAHSSSTAQ